MHYTSMTVERFHLQIPVICVELALLQVRESDLHDSRC